MSHQCGELSQIVLSSVSSTQVGKNFLSDDQARTNTIEYALPPCFIVQRQLVD